MPRMSKTAPAFVLCATTLLASSVAASTAPPALQRQTSYGTLLGAADASSGTLKWLGIPYAKPPVGPLRWMPPVAPDTWSGLRSAQAFGASCAQTGSVFSPAPGNAPYGLSVRDGFGKPVGSEDCLTLNIWRPANADANLPVVFFIHGGSNVSGYSADPIYDGAALAAREHVVVVTINYRLGMFGWLDMSQVKTGDPIGDSGNFGTLDQIQALRYVRANIAAFGGNPGNVTVMGQSAGAVDTWALIVSPLAGGLFHKAVPLSGGLQTSDAVLPKVYAAALLTKLLVTTGKAPNDFLAGLYLLSHGSQEIAAWLRGLSTQQLLQAEEAAGLFAPAVFADGRVLPSVPQLALAAGQYNHVPVLAGNTNEEAKLFGLINAFKLGDYDRFTAQYRFDPNAPPTLTERDLLNAAYLPVDKPLLGWNAVSADFSNAVFTAGTSKAMGALAAQQPGQAWYYRFDWKQEPAPFDTVYGAAHAMDLPFVFGNFGPSSFSFSYSNANAPGRLALSGAMMDTLGAFAATGNPTSAAVGGSWPNWPAMVVFDASQAQANVHVGW